MSAYKSKREKYIDLKINGRIFPSWIIANFKAYKLPEILHSDDDACFRKTKTELRKYQIFLGKFLDFNSPYKNVLIYYGVGAGKTAATINIYNILYNASPGINVFLLLKASLKTHPWMDSLQEWLLEEEKKYRMENIVFISYDAPNADKAFMDAIKNSDSSKKNLFIIEESHNFIRNVYGNITTRKGKRAQVIYDYIIQNQKENDSTRVILLSGTPAVNYPFELALTFNLLRPGIFPKSESLFNQEFISSSSYRTLNPAKKNLFQRRILGLVSYYYGSTPEFFASKKIEYVDVVMSKYQEDIYTYYEKMEEKINKKNKSRSSSSSSTYKSYTRQACNFTFPLMAQGISGETRPRPRDFKVSEKEGDFLEKGNDSLIEKNSDKYYNIQNYIDATLNFVKLFDEYLQERNRIDEKEKHTLVDDIKIFIDKYKGNYVDFHKNESVKSTIYDEMYKCSAKMLHIIFNIMKSPGPVLIYSNYVLMEGLQIFKIYLKQFGFSSIAAEDSGTDFFRYTEYHGGIKKENRGKNLEEFNNIENKYGKICKIMMISPAGAEGLNLFNVRQIHLMEPYWHESRMIQMIGRGVRFCSHKALPKSERHVDIFRYKSVRENINGKISKMTTDQIIDDLARGKEGLIQSFLDAIKEASVDCVLNKPHNALMQDYKCFQFEEESLFDEQIGPAYKEDIYDDMKMDNGSNSTMSQTTRIKVIKIKAAKLLSSPDAPEIKYSSIEYYWYNPQTLVVYDYELHYPIGKIGQDDDNLPKKLDKDTYIIDKVIPIPMINDK
jgi:hypothetical protein